MNCSFENCSNNATHKHSMRYGTKESIENFLCEKHERIISENFKDDFQTIEIQNL